MSDRWTAEVRVELRPGIADPEGTTIGSALRMLGYDVADVRHGKLMRISFAAPDRAAAEAQVTEMCTRLLANPVMEVARWELTFDAATDAGAASDVGVVPR
jgi:phosphoribosylformylglycinamidine synthase